MSPNSDAASKPLFVRLSADDSAQLYRAAEQLAGARESGLDLAASQRELRQAAGHAHEAFVGQLVARFTDPESDRGLATIAELREAGVSTRQDVLTASQAALLLQVDEKTLIDLADRGRFPGRQVGDEWRFSRSALLSWLAERE